MADIAPKRLQLALEGGFTSGASSVYNGGAPVKATRRLAVESSTGADWKPVWSRPVEARGTYAGTYQTLLEQIFVTGKMPAAVYCDDLAWYARMCVSGNPTVTTLPASPTSLLAATAVAATMSLTTQPNATGDGATAKILAVTLTAPSPLATAVNVQVSGQSITGAALTETLNFPQGTETNPANPGGPAIAAQQTVTLYTQNYFKTVNASGITTTAQPATMTLAVGGVNAFLWQCQPDLGVSTLYSATMEYDDGTAGWQMPGVVFDKFDLALEVGKSFKMDSGFQAQKKTPLAGSTGSINTTASAGDRNSLQNLKDNAMAAVASALANFYADPVGAVFGTTAVPARITSYKLSVANDVKLGKAGDNTPYPNFVGRGYYGDKMAVEFTLLFNAYVGSVDPAELANFLSYTSRNIRVAVPGAPLPCGVLNTASGWPAALQQNAFGGYYGLMLDTTGKYEVANEKPVDGRMALSFQQKNEVDVIGLGVGYQVTFVSRVNPYMF